MRKKIAFMYLVLLVFAVLITLIWSDASRNKPSVNLPKQAREIAPPSPTPFSVSVTNENVDEPANFMDDMTPAALTTTGVYNFGPFDPSLSLIELQGWWTPLEEDGLKDKGTGFGHMHILCKWPVGRKVKDVFADGIMRTNCRLTLHDNPGKMDLIRVDLASGGVVHKQILNLYPGSPQSQPNRCFYNGQGSTNCSWDVAMNVDTNKWPAGWNHFRLRFTLSTVDGKKHTTSSEIPVQIGTSSVVKDKAFSDCLTDCFVAKSWYTGFDYQRVRIKNLPINKKVSGTYTFYVQAWKGNSPKTKRLVAQLDRSHFIPATGTWPEEPASAGPILLDIQNPEPNKLYPVTIDTTTLANGWHSFAARTIEAKPGIATCSYCTKEENFQSAVGKFYFYIEN